MFVLFGKQANRKLGCLVRLYSQPSVKEGFKQRLNPENAVNRGRCALPRW